MPPSSNPRILIIGAGVTGLSAAHCLLELSEQRGLPLDIAVLEASDRVGGVVRTERRDGFLIELGPDNFITNRPHAIDLCRRLGLEDELIETNPRPRYRRALVVRKGRLVPIPVGFELMLPRRLRPLLASPILSWRGKLRALAERFVKCRPNASDDDDESLASFVRRRFGREVLDRLVQPLVGGIYTADPETLSLRATVPRFLDMEREHGGLIKAAIAQRKAADASNEAASATGARYSLFVSLRDGMQRLTDSLAAKLGDRVRLHTRVAGIQPGAEATPWRVVLDDGATLDADALLIAAPAHISAPWLAPVDAPLAELVGEIGAASSAVVIAAYDRGAIGHALDAFGFVVPAIERRGIIAGAFASVKYGGRAPDGRVLLRAFMGGATGPDLLDQSDDELAATATAELADLLSIRGGPLFTMVQRYDRAMPQYAVGHVAKVRRIRELLSHHEGVELAGASYDGVGIPDCIAGGEAAAQRIVDSLLAAANH